MAQSHPQIAIGPRIAKYGQSSPRDFLRHAAMFFCGKKKREIESRLGVNVRAEAF